MDTFCHLKGYLYFFFLQNPLRITLQLQFCQPFNKYKQKGKHKERSAAISAQEIAALRWQ